MSVRLPALLGASLTEVARLHPTAMSVTLKMVGSAEASITLPEDAPPVAVHDWISIYTPNGLAGIFRVTNAAQNYKKQIDLTLLHGIDILSDSVWAAQTEFTGTKTEYLTALLNQQTHLINGVKPWVLGTCADTSNVKKEINYDRLSNLLEEQVEEGGAYYFTYDMSSFPWTISYVARDQTVTSEFRLTRNVRSATVTYNDADLCTRLHLSINHKVEDEDTSVTSTDTIIKTYDNSTAQASWGIVVKTADIDTGDNVKATPPVTTEADAWAAAFLVTRAAPSVQIQIDGDELKQLTGDTWDEYKIGRLCQVALPDYGHTFQERVVAVGYPDLLKDPLHVTVSMANNLPKFSETIARIRDEAERASRSARGAGRAAADAKELTTWSQHVSYYGDALDGTGVMTLYESGIDMDAAGGVTVFSLEEGLQSLYGGISVNSRKISLVVTESGGQDVVNTASIVLGINNQDKTSSSYVDISANFINLSGYVTASSLNAVDAKIDNLTSGVSTASVLRATSFYGSQATIGSLAVSGQNSSFSVFGSDVTWKPVTVGGTQSATSVLGTGGTGVTVPDAITDINIVAPTGSSNTYTLQKKTFSNTSWQDIGNFNRAGGVITAITKSSQTWKPLIGTYGGYEVGVYASGTNVGTYSDTIEVDAATAYSSGWAEGYDDGVGEFSSSIKASKYNSGNSIELFSKSGNFYFSAGTHVWYYQSTTGTQYYTKR